MSMDMGMSMYEYMNIIYLIYREREPYRADIYQF